ncbi:MAG: LolA family protein [Bacteroidota bacterium]|nr:outer membrane lipoprotein carrier protein LolA [Bacteroidia bacterium]MBP7270856.1 outer membrane lipoprotein carrier protein LolA [Bacteroidia bacterium]HPD53488.1 outer membrane lipoprotein carrier protein LolA [Bacteroidia bacterium]HRI40654.1 outer membrane lipoprotein carrier protein LolA [Bacteroidia bacterium]
MKLSTSLLASLLLFFPFLSLAQNGSDAKSQEVLKSVSAKYKSFKSLKASFTVTIESPGKAKEVQKGTLYIKGDKYRLEFAGQDVISDGKTRWTYVKDANEIQIDNQRKDENAITPTNIFTLYEKGWNSKYIGEAKEPSGPAHQIELVPIEPKKKNVFKVKIAVSKADKFIVSAKVFDKNGGFQTFQVDKLSPDILTDDTQFVYNATRYPGAEVVDLR